MSYRLFSIGEMPPMESFAKEGKAWCLHKALQYEATAKIVPAKYRQEWLDHAKMLRDAANMAEF